MNPAAAVLLASMVLATLAPAAHASTGPLPGQNGTANSFGSIEAAMAYGSDGESVPVEARVRFVPGGGIERAHRVMVAFNVKSERVDVTFDSITTADGTPIPLAGDERFIDPRQPKVFLEAHDLPAAGQEIFVTGHAAATYNGRFHIGVLVVAFDLAWQNLVTPAGEPAELYAWGFVEGSGFAVPRGAPPFEGEGNVSGPWLATLFMFVAFAIVVGLFWSRWFRPVRDATRTSGPVLQATSPRRIPPGSR